MGISPKTIPVMDELQRLQDDGVLKFSESAGKTKRVRIRFTDDISRFGWDFWPTTESWHERVSFGKAGSRRRGQGLEALLSLNGVER